ncbi:MAG: Succinate dehydrogenase iron-sulfur protein [uncultured Thermomicrobiales bacterium]|uniref:Succinate dehydrogenase iron-sulfur subunit n=1 Tax=uncultured Thermomicrobiales bacterium TaxID=1645740 RepID=A0A6J4ULQ4_9BACT|nr:MAG: Succinate dehydrogenase iron-sulfur protein [uncultured Thermomicrobiales bacterium]
MEYTLRIKRYNPDQDVKPAFKEYTLDLAPTDRVLDGLNQIKWNHDGSLTYRRSCGHGVCGSDAMRINGRNRLACKVLMQELGRRVTIEPLIGYAVVKDLVVDMDQFFASYKAVKPYLIADDSPSAGERRQSPAQRERFDDTTKCILCAACTTSCPITWTNENFVGPAAIVNAHRFIFDSRDQGGAERLRILNGQSGVWRCRTVFNCTDACPRGIEVTKAIEEVKRALLYEQVV